jgi:hypothetical protein
MLYRLPAAGLWQRIPFPFPAALHLLAELLRLGWRSLDRHMRGWRRARQPAAGARRCGADVRSPRWCTWAIGADHFRRTSSSARSFTTGPSSSYLHFQLNGWFWFAALALWSALGGDTRRTARPLDRLTIRLWTVSAWSSPSRWPSRGASTTRLVYAVNSIGVVILQLWAGWRTANAILAAPRKSFRTRRPPLWAWRCVTYALIGMGLKVLMQAAVAIPQVAILAFTVRNFVIGFIHLNTLGAISLMLFAMALLRRLVRSPLQ